MSTVAAITAVQVAAGAAVVGAAATIHSGIEQGKAQKAQVKAEKRAREVENAVSRVETAKATRQRISQQRIEQGNLEQGAEASGVSGSSSLFGSVGSSASSASGDIGLAQARLSGATGAANIRSAGAAQASGHFRNAAISTGIASVSSMFVNPTRNAQIATAFKSS
jgi:hypothetical protein